MKILTFNCYGLPFIKSSIRVGKRMRLIARRIKKLNPDVVLLQEVFFPCHKRTFARMLKKDYPYRYLPRRGLLCTGGGLCCFSRYPIIDRRFKAFSVVGFWRDKTWRDKFARKGFIRLKIKKGQTTFYVFHTHITANYFEEYSMVNPQAFIQKVQLIQFAKSINQISKQTSCFVAGDLNVPPNTELFLNFLKKTNCVDLTKSVKVTWRGKRTKIDYVLFRNGKPRWFRCRTVFKRGVLLSDHYGLLVTINI